ncbi:hypothetical protein ACFL6I_09825 [candidate division KSB1 bacterium]
MPQRHDPPVRPFSSLFAGTSPGSPSPKVADLNELPLLIVSVDHLFQTRSTFLDRFFACFPPQRLHPVIEPPSLPVDLHLDLDELLDLFQRGYLNGYLAHCNSFYCK